MEKTISQEKGKLPERFLRDMELLLGREEYERYLKAFSQEKIQGLRVNTGKLSPGAFAALCGKSLTPVPWAANGFYYHQDPDASWEPAKDPYYYAGLYYLQEPSAMAPASFLPVSPGDKVLALCAAPGGKATELGARLGGQGMLLANDISNSRAKALLKNLELSGTPNFCVASEPPQKLACAFPGFFHKVLVDAPCSGEGMFRKDPDMAKDWEKRGPAYYAPIQREILTSGAAMVKPGGYLLYSTCTFSKKEDEEQIQWFLAAHPEFELVPLPLFPGAAEGFGLPGAIRLFPHKVKGEGHFLALLHKKGQPGKEKSVLRETGQEPGTKARQASERCVKGTVEKASPKEPPSQGLREFLSKVSRPFDHRRIRKLKESFYYLPQDFPEGMGLRYLRTGLLLGREKGGRFEPSQALAMALRPEEFPQAIRFSHEDERIIRYLKGETVALTGREAAGKGWCLVCVEDFPLGWAKGCGETLKNKYYPGWRFQ